MKALYLAFAAVGLAIAGASLAAIVTPWNPFGLAGGADWRADSPLGFAVPFGIAMAVWGWWASRR